MRHRWPVILPPEPLELGGASSSGPKPAGSAEKNPTFECRAAPGLPRGEASARATKGRSCSAGRHPACFRGHSVKPSGPYPLGKNQSLSSPPLEPRGLLLSVMRQKVGKERSQGVFAPLAIPRCYPNLAELTPVCECPAAPQKTAMQNIATGSEQTFQPKDQPGSHYDGRRYPPRQAAIRRSTRRDCAFR